MVKPDTNKSIQYMELIENNIFLLVWLNFTSVCYIFNSLPVYDNTFCRELCNFLKLAVCYKCRVVRKTQNNINQISNIKITLPYFRRYHSLTFQCPGYLTVTPFLTQGTRKCYRTLGFSLKCHRRCRAGMHYGAVW